MDTVGEPSRAIRKTRNLSIVLFFFFPVVSLASAGLFRVLGLRNEHALIILIPYVVVFFVVGIRWSYAPCPLCDAPMFYRRFFFYGFFRCVHCGYDLKDPKTSRVIESST